MSSPGLDWQRADKAQQLPPELEDGMITWKYTARETRDRQETWRLLRRHTGDTHRVVTTLSALEMRLTTVLHAMKIRQVWWQQTGATVKKDLSKDGTIESTMKGW